MPSDVCSWFWFMALGPGAGPDMVFLNRHYEVFGWFTDDERGASPRLAWSGGLGCRDPRDMNRGDRSEGLGIKRQQPPPVFLGYARWAAHTLHIIETSLADC
ncbi:hypothetical protein LX32DRAFT_643573 [Colletotrichum zoysiae]|uniref:Uncharacterized protein n=1 Tax=Colletotrichum zoysiae TaxID=1216348 RepID=A0AAD9H9W7_9PEZI|nr:hypothetical protein LX32DRAFT_643573 [Colletotrichum zoysiae]